MKFSENIQEVALLQPDYLGFIFYEKSARNFDGAIPTLPDTIKKTGVFVDASLDFIMAKVMQYGFGAIQLHGNESATYCGVLKEKLSRVTAQSEDSIEVFKVFSIKDTFDFNQLTPYEGLVDYFLFDTKGKEKGGNGYTFDWSVLQQYTATTPFILSGGIGLQEIDKLQEILLTDLPIYAVDVNSKLESAPGLKNSKAVADFISGVTTATIKNKKLREG